MLQSHLLEAAQAISDEIVGLRRAIHAEPELGLHTPRTRDKVRAALAGLPLTWREGPSATGLVATLHGAGPGRHVLLRGDMDALPMPEDTGLPFASEIQGAMHACGHDAHTAMLVGAARVLAGRQAGLSGTVSFMFQPGEEGHHGARFMLEDGLLDPLPDAAFALHVMPNAKHGQVAGRAGALMAAADQFEIMIKGAGGHASMPHQTHDPVVVTVARIEGGTAHNVIADFATLKGTMRTLSPGHRAQLHDALGQLASGISAAHGLSAEVTITEGFPVTICDPRAVAFGERVIAALLGKDAWQTLPAPIMGAEDFAYVLEKVPGAMFFLGVAEDGADWNSCCGIHSPRMMVDEAVLPRGAAVLAGLAEEFLASGF